jgi:hypothetical protein
MSKLNLSFTVPAKDKIYRYFTYVSVILRLRSGCTLQYYAILPIFVWRFHSNPPRALIPTPSCSSMHPKWSGSQIQITTNQQPAKMQKSQLWTFITFWLGIFSQNFGKLLIYIYNIMIIFPKFAPILRSQKKVDFLFLCSGSIYIYILHHSKH